MPQAIRRVFDGSGDRVTATHPTKEALAAAQQFIDTLWSGTRYESPGVHELAATLDALAAEAVSDARETALREAAIAVNAIQDQLPNDNKPDGSFDHIAAIKRPEARRIWWTCRQAIFDLMANKKSASVKENDE